jgi:predicted MarR family transcription regulator
VITPDQVSPSGASSEHARDRETLEGLCDQAIRNADRAQEWPAHVRRIHQRLDDHAIQETMDKYERAGWVIRTTKGRDHYFTIDRPGTATSATFYANHDDAATATATATAPPVKKARKKRGDR